MINKARGRWQEVEHSAQRLKKRGDAEPSDGVLREIAGVREVLQHMCQASVTRTSLREAVREVLLPLLREHRDELVETGGGAGEGAGSTVEAPAPLLGSGSSGGGASTMPEGVLHRLDSFEERIRRLAALDAEMLSSVDALGDRLQSVDGRVDGVDGRLGEMVSDLRGFAELLQNTSGRFDSTDEQVGALDVQLLQIGETLTQLDGRIAGSETRLDGVDERVGDVGTRLNDVGTHLSDVGEGLEDVRDGLRAQGGRMEGIDGRLLALSGRLESVDGKVREEVLKLAEQLTAVDGRLSELSVKMESLHGRVEEVNDKARESEEHLRKELEEMVQAMVERLAELRDMLQRVEGNLPEKGAVEARIVGLEERVDHRLEGVTQKVTEISGDLRDVRAGVANVDSVTPEIRSLAARFTEVRQALEAITGGIQDGEQGTRSIANELGGRLDQLQGVLDGGIKRWESDQSYTLERLSAIRDSLRDELQQVSAHVQKAQGSLLGRVMGRRDPGGVKLRQDEWEQLSGKIEGIVSGLESILSRRRPT